MSRRRAKLNAREELVKSFECCLQDGTRSLPPANRAALDVQLTQDDLEALDREFPLLSRKVPFEVL